MRYVTAFVRAQLACTVEASGKQPQSVPQTRLPGGTYLRLQYHESRKVLTVQDWGEQS